MNYKITCISPAHFDPLLDEFIEKKEVIHELPFAYGQEVWFAIRKRKKWTLIHDEISSCWCTNGPVGYQLKYSDFCVEEDSFARLFDTKRAAINFCLQENELMKIKIKEHH